MSYALITQLQKKAVPVQQSCRVLAVSRAGYYSAQPGPAKPLLCKVGVHLKTAFATSQRSYGSRRLVSVLATQCIKIGRYKARRLMRQAGLKPVWRRKFIHTTDSNHALPIAENILVRQFNPDTPNTAFVTDITYIRTGTGWLYLAMVLDLFSRKVVAWAMAVSMPAELVCEALQMAIVQRRPATGLIVHSDRGYQYASKQYQALLTEHGFTCSMSRRASCWDNAVVDRIILNFKMERAWQRTHVNRAEAKMTLPTTSSTSTIALDCIQYWATCRPPSPSGK